MDITSISQIDGQSVMPCQEAVYAAFAPRASALSDVLRTTEGDPYGRDTLTMQARRRALASRLS